MGVALNVGTLDLLYTLQFEAVLANLEAIDDVKEWFVGSFAFQVHQVTIVVAVTFGTTQAEQAGVLHTQDGNNGLEEELVINVSGFINDNDIGSCASGGLTPKKREVSDKNIKDIWVVVAARSKYWWNRFNFNINREFSMLLLAFLFTFEIR